MLNSYNDKLIENAGKGADIASQRLDDLDLACLADAQMRSDGNFVLVDAGCGRCGFINQVARHVSTGILVALDVEDFAEFAAEGVTYVQGDMREGIEHLGRTIDILYSQRTIHYLTYAEAKAFLTAARNAMNSGSALFLSASGIGTELAEGYPGRDLPVTDRHHLLDTPMAEKHGIRQPVCLYSQQELVDLVTSVGFEVRAAAVSEFGNVKIIAVLS